MGGFLLRALCKHFDLRRHPSNERESKRAGGLATLNVPAGANSERRSLLGFAND
jgi:hypothetical protein